jgi:hypothetical protein
MSTHDESYRSWRGPLIALAAIFAVVMVVLAMLGSQVSGILSTVGASVGGYPNDDPGDVAGDDDGADTDTGGDGDGSGVIAGAPRDELLIIKTGTLTLRVDAIGAALSEVTRRVDALGGYTSGSERAGTGADATATITFRVPAAAFDAAMDAARGVAAEVLGERSTTDDVTSQVVDLGARVRNLMATELALQSIMDRATVVKDVLSIQAELTTVRGEIERLTAEKAHLEERAAFSTLTAMLVLAPPPAVVEQQAQFDPAVEVEAASASMIGVLQGVATAGIWFGIVWLPILLALGLVAGVGIFIGRRVRRSTSPGVAGN